MARSTELPVQLAQPLEILLPGENLGLEPAQGVGARRLLLKRSAADHGLHRGVLGQPLGIVGVFIPCQAAIDRLAQ